MLKNFKTRNNFFGYFSDSEYGFVDLWSLIVFCTFSYTINHYYWRYTSMTNEFFLTSTTNWIIWFKWDDCTAGSCFNECSKITLGSKVLKENQKFLIHAGRVEKQPATRKINGRNFFLTCGRSYKFVNAGNCKLYSAIHYQYLALLFHRKLY